MCKMIFAATVNEIMPHCAGYRFAMLCILGYYDAWMLRARGLPLTPVQYEA